MKPTREQVIEARRALTAVACGVCGEKKTRGHVFCRGCFWRLPADLRNGLYRDALSAEYAETYVRAVGLLKPAAEGEEKGTGRLF